MVHMAIKVEKQLKHKCTNRVYSNAKPSKWGENTNKESTTIPKTNKPMAETSKGKAPERSTTRLRDIKCFKCLRRGHIASQCLNRRTMVLRADGEIETEDEEENESESIFENEEDLE
ncbi:hypothetical protein EPI10_028314 [Gossypium australe]|uniref:CCHC-type domain-containing protein n=1 Tax=Gossypium australe TaxID=47621 RepID=A0A5B6UY49_9ROSI|nr:hypothetical protein EPI10_028314 [Gossypium australe]